MIRTVLLITGSLLNIEYSWIWDKYSLFTDGPYAYLACLACLPSGLKDKLTCLPSRRASPIGQYQIHTAWWQRHMGVNNLSKVVTQNWAEMIDLIGLSFFSERSRGVAITNYFFRPNRRYLPTQVTYIHHPGIPKSWIGMTALNLITLLYNNP